MSWEFAPSPDAAVRSALAAGKPVVAVVPPAGWMLAPVLDLLPAPAGGLGLVLLVPDVEEARELAATLGWVAPLRPLHACTGLARTHRLLAAGTVGTLVVTPSDAMGLVQRSALPLASLPRLAVVRPEAMDGELLAGLLTEAAGAQRLFFPADLAAASGLLDRYAHRAPVWRAVPDPSAPVGEVHVVTSDERQRPALARDLLDQANPSAAFLWEALPTRVGRWMDLARDPALTVAAEPPEGPLDLALLPDLPTPDLLQALAPRTRRVVALVRPDQVSVLARWASVRSQRVRGEADRAADRAQALRERVRTRLEQGGLDAELMAVAPLLDRHDPALVAAAALALLGAPAPSAPVPAWAKLRLNVGKQDGVRPADVVGALINAVGLPKDHVGRVELKEAFAVVEVRAEHADAALRGLTGISLRGRRVQAQPDRR